LPARPYRGFGPPAAGHATGMSVTDPDTPDPLNDPRTTQADPGAVAQGADLASADDDPAATGDDELAAGAADVTETGGLPEMGGIPASGGVDPEPEVDTGAPFTQVAPPT
jgi:hypothetical protein